jgi:hypothetical protein
MLMGAREAPGVIDGYLRRYWSHHLALVILRDGTESERFTQARASGERLWAAMLASEAGQLPTESIAGLVEPVLASSGVTGHPASEIVDAIESLLAAFRHGDRHGVDASALPATAVAGNAPEAVASATPNNVVPLRPLPESIKSRALASEAAVETEAAPKVTERGVDGHFNSFWSSEQGPVPIPAATLPSATAIPDLSVVAGTDTISADPADVDRIRKLEVGNWVEMIGEDGSAQPAKLSWVSPISNRLLFVNRRGMRVCAVSAEELAVMLKQGKLSLREIDTAFERAMTQVLGKLRESQGQRTSA